MNEIKLHSGANDLLRIMHLNKQDQLFVKKCIYNYSKPSAIEFDIRIPVQIRVIVATSTWVWYRTGNAIKSIFGRSDWQIAKQSLIDQAHRIIRKKCPIWDDPVKKMPTFKLLTPQQRANWKKLNQSITMVAEELLQICLLAQENRTETTPSLRHKLKNVDLENHAVKVAKIFKKAHPRPLHFHSI